MRRARALAIAAALVALPAAAGAQPDGDAGVPLVDGGSGPDASPRIVIDGPTMLGIGRPQVSASAAPSEVRLGDKLTLFIEVTYDDQVTVSIPSGLELAPVFDELKRSSVDERRTDGTRKRIYQVQLQVWDLGDLRIPPIQVAYTVGGQSSWVVTNDVPIRVVGTIDAIDDPNAFLGAAPPVGLRRRDWRLIALGVTLAMLAIGGLAAWLIARWSRRQKPKPIATAAAPMVAAADRAGRDDAAAPAVPANPIEHRPPPGGPALFVVTFALRGQLGDAARRALDAIDTLERSGTLTSDPREGFRALVAIIHAFAGAQFQLPPRHRTTAELEAALAHAPVPPDARTAATAWLAACDRVKYGAATVDDGGARACSEARALVVLASGLPIEGAP